MSGKSVAAASKEDMLLRNRVCEPYRQSPEGFPLTYTYRGTAYRGMPAGSRISTRLVDANLEETVIEGQTDDLRVRAECLMYRDFPVMEWTVYFTPAGEWETGILEGVRAIDTVLAGHAPVLTHNNGDFYSPEGYTDSETALPEGATFTQAPDGGRSCDRAFPYQRLLFDDGYGLNIAIGWPGQWACGYTGLSDGVRFWAGQETVHTVIRPGETLRTPRITLHFFHGPATRGVNMWRRWYRAHVLPRKLDGPIGPIIPFSDNGGGIEFQEANEQQQLASIRKLRNYVHGGNIWWIDAGWYPCRREDGQRDWTVTGTWIPDPERFPHGLLPVSEAAEEAGLDLLVWFEPERVRPDSRLAAEHPDWILKCDNPNDPNRLLNLTNPDCLQWVCESFAGMLRDNGIKVYRQDFNFAPLPFWRDNEAEDRRGMLENLYVQGLLAFWDYLLLHVPGLWLDSCAAGGRRNDMEMMRRAVPLHPTDYGYGYHHINQAFRITLFNWLPFARGWCSSWDRDGEYYRHDDYYAPEDPKLDNFKLVNGMGVHSNFGSTGYYEAHPDEVPYIQKMIDIWEKFAPLQLNGDYYGLTEPHRSNARWTVFQFDCPEDGTGAFQALRNNQCPKESITVFPQGMGPGAYELWNDETGERYEVVNPPQTGITFTQPVRSGAIWFYRAKD